MFTRRYLARRREEYERIRVEIEALRWRRNWEVKSHDSLQSQLGEGGHRALSWNRFLSVRWSARFGKEVYVTRHARERLAQRRISEAELADLLENGEARYKDPERLWIAKAFPERNDNLIWAPVVLEEYLVVKTVMHHFEWGK